MSSPTGVRLTLKFNFSQRIRMCGWSESYDLGYNSLATAITNQANIVALLTDRCNCLGYGPLLIEAVLSAYTPPVALGAPPPRRSTITLPLPPFPFAGSAYNPAFVLSKLSGIENWAADFSTTVYYVSVQTVPTDTPVYRRNLWIAGCPDVSDETDSAQIEQGDVLTAISRFLNDLSNNTYTGGIPTNGSKNTVSVRSVDRSNGNPVKTCTGWNLGANTYTVPAHGFVQNQPVLAEGMRTAIGGSCPRGKYLVNLIDANTISLQGSSTPTPPKALGGFRAFVYAFNPVALVVPGGFSKRNKGRPFDPLVGRRRKPNISRA